jgi:hypothetical protein
MSSKVGREGHSALAAMPVLIFKGEVIKRSFASFSRQILTRMEAYRRALMSGTGYCCSASSFAAGVCQKKAAGAGRAVGTGGDRPRIYSPIV